MTEQKTAPYGEWESPFPISLLTAGVVSLGEVRAIGGVGWWLEGRPDEEGRQVLVRRATDGSNVRRLSWRSPRQNFFHTPLNVTAA